MRIRRITVTGLAMLGVAVGCLLSWSAQAPAFMGHIYASSFGPGGPGVGSFSDVQGIAIDDSSGDVYVLDRNRETEVGLIYKFNASGEPEEFTALKAYTIEQGYRVGYNNENELAVDNSPGPAKGDLYYANHIHPEIYAPDGSFLGELTSIHACGVAVDASGNVYFGEGGEKVYKFTPAANPVMDADYVSSLSGVGGPCSVAADSEGNVYVDSFRSGPVTKYPASQFGELSSAGTQIDTTGVTLAVDPLTNGTYIDEDDDIAEYDSNGSLVSTFAALGAGAITGSDAIAVYAPSSSTTTIYVANGENGTVELFKSIGVIPDVSSKPTAEVVAGTSATVEGVVNPDGTELTACQVEYGTSVSYGQTAPCSSVPSGEKPATVTAQITGLLPGIVYHYRFEAANAKGGNQGIDERFLTAGAVDGQPAAASNISQFGATLAATIDSGLLPTSYHFAYGTTSAYGSVVPVPDLYAPAGQKVRVVPGSDWFGVLA